MFQREDPFTMSNAYYRMQLRKSGNKFEIKRYFIKACEILKSQGLRGLFRKIRQKLKGK